MAATRNGVHPLVLEAYDYAVAWYRYLTGESPTLTSGSRSADEQRQLYANRANNPYPVNRPGDSAHEYGLAIDSWVPEKTFTIQGHRWNSWALWTAIREAVGFRVPSNDRVHSEVPNWRQYV